MRLPEFLAERLYEDLTFAVEHGTKQSLAEAVFRISNVVGTTDPIIDALERPRSRPVPLSPALTACHFVTGIKETWAPARQLSEETFLAQVLRLRVADREGPSSVRIAARRVTLAALAARGGDTKTAFVNAVDVRVPAPIVSAHPNEVLAFDPAEAFLELPPAMRTWETLGQLLFTSRLVPFFQLSLQVDERQPEHEIVAKVNTILGAGEDPWGAASWWVTENAWLGANPIDLLGSSRAAEIGLAATELTSEAW